MRRGEIEKYFVFFINIQKFGLKRFAESNLFVLVKNALHSCARSSEGKFTSGDALSNGVIACLQTLRLLIGYMSKLGISRPIFRARRVQSFFLVAGQIDDVDINWPVVFFLSACV